MNAIAYPKGTVKALSRSLRRKAAFSPREARETAEYALFAAGFWPIFLFFFAWFLPLIVFPG